MGTFWKCWILQENGFFSVCIFKFEFSEHADPQHVHEYGFSSVCVQMCIFKCENTDPHAWHM